MAIDFTPDNASVIDFTPDPIIEPATPGKFKPNEIGNALGETALGTVDTAAALIPAPLAWMMQTGGELGLMGLGTALDKLGIQDATPQEIVEASKALSQQYIGDKFYQPQTEMGQQAVGMVGKGIETFLIPSHKAGEFAGKLDPRLGYVTSLAGELLQFGLAHVAAVKTKNAIKGQPPPIIPEGAYRGEVEAKAKELGLPKDAVDKVLSELKIKEAADAAAKTPTFKAKFEGNQTIAEALRAEAAKREGRSKSAYTKAAQKVEQAEGPITGDMVAKDPKAKTRVLVEDMLVKQTKIGEDVPGFVEPKVEPKIEPVIEKPKVKAPPKEVPIKPLISEAKVVDTSIVTKPKIDFVPDVIEDVKPTIKTSTESKTPANVIEFKSKPEAESKYELGSEITRRKASREAAQTDRLPGAATIKVGERYYRAVEKTNQEILDIPVNEPAPPIAERLKALQEIDERVNAPKVKPPVVEATPEPTPTPVAEVPKPKITAKEVTTAKAEVKEAKKSGDTTKLVEAYKKYKERYVEKLNEASTSTSISPVKSKPITRPENLSIINDEFATFKTKAEADAYTKATGKKTIKDPLTGEYLVEPKLDDFLNEGEFYPEGLEEMRFTDRVPEEGFDAEYELSDIGTRNLWDVFNNDRGAVEVRIPDLQKHIDKIEYILKAAKRAKMPVEDLLKSRGMDTATIEQFKVVLAQLPKDKDTVRQAQPIIEGILHPIEPLSKINKQTKKVKKSKVVHTMPPITEKIELDLAKADPKMTWGKLVTNTNLKGKNITRVQQGWINRFMGVTETRIRGLHKYGLGWLYEARRSTMYDALQEKKVWSEKLKELDVKLTDKEWQDLSIAAYADQVGGKEGMASMGITEIPAMTPKMVEVFKFFTEAGSEFFDRVNYVRTKTGKNAIPRLLDINGNENYIHLMRQLNVLREMGIIEGMVDSKISRLSAISKDFSGIFNPTEKHRKVSDIPIELDIRKAFKEYINYTVDEIHTAPVAALAHEMSNAKIKIGDKKVKLHDYNPDLSAMLYKWSSEIMGKDQTFRQLMKDHPFMGKAALVMSKNLPTAIIGGLVRTAIVQPSALLQAYTHLDLPSMTYGIGRLFVDRPFRGKAERAWNKSKTLSTRNPDVAITQLSELIQQNLISKGRKIALDASYLPMKYTDSITARAVFDAAFYYAEKKLKYGEEKARIYADDIVDMTQGSGVKGAVSPIQSTVLGRLLTMLGTFAISDWNVLIRDVVGLKNPDVTNVKHIQKALKYMIGGTLMGYMYQSIGIDDVFPDPVGAYLDAKEENKNEPAAIGLAAMEFLEKIPMLGGVFKYGSTPLGVVGEYFNVIADATGSAAELLDWGNLSRRQQRMHMLTIFRAVGYTLGIPGTNQMIKSIKAKYNGGNPMEIIIGSYVEEAERLGMPIPPSPPKPPKPGR